jgi:hypothetical protein
VIVALFALLWLFVLRPQRRRSTEQLQQKEDDDPDALTQNESGES